MHGLNIKVTNWIYVFVVDLRTIVRYGQCLLGHVNEPRSHDTVKCGTFLPPNYHSFSAAFTAGCCFSPVLVWASNFVAVESRTVPFAVIHEQPFPLPQYYGIGDLPNQWRTQEFFSGGFNKFSWGQRERGSGGGSPLVRGSGSSCNLVQEISFHIVKFS